MPKKQQRPSFRMERINDMIQQNLALLLLREVQDPRLQTVTITGVEITPDLSRAKIHFVIPNEQDLSMVEKGLAQASGFLRSSLAKACQLRVMPQLYFYYDSSFREGGKIDALLRQVLDKH